VSRARTAGLKGLRYPPRAVASDSYQVRSTDL
jgi:hypothetical protein